MTPTVAGTLMDEGEAPDAGTSGGSASKSVVGDAVKGAAGAAVLGGLASMFSSNDD